MAATMDDIENRLTWVIQQIAVNEEDSRAVAKDVMRGLQLKHVLCVDNTSDEFKPVQAGVNEIIGQMKDMLERKDSSVP
jgi:hypothetical protein